MDPIVGPRYECRKCYEKDFSDGVDLCQRCKDDNLHSQHNSFLRKIEEPTDFDMKALRKGNVSQYYSCQSETKEVDVQITF